MSETKRRTSVGGWAIVALVVALLYVPGVGPAVWIERHFFDPSKTTPIKVIYAPLVWVSQSNDTINRAITWYVELWE